MPEASPQANAPPELAVRSEWLANVRKQYPVEIDQAGLAPPRTIKEEARVDPENADKGARGLIEHKLDERDTTAQTVFDRLLEEAGTNGALEHAIRPKHSLLSEEEQNQDIVLSQEELASNPNVQDLLGKRQFKKEHEHLAKIYPAVKEHLQAGLTKGIEEGYLPAVVASRLETAFGNLPVRVADSLILPDNFIGGYDQRRDEVGLADYIVHPEVEREFLVELLEHEIIHQLSGGTFEKSPDGTITRQRLGYGTELSGNRAKRNGLNEFATVQASIGILTGDFETMDPNKQQYKSPAWFSPRMVYAAAFDRSGGILNAKLLLNGLFEDTGSEGSSEARRALVKSAKLAYGKAALNKLEKMAEVANQFDPEMVEKYILPHIHPPKLSKDGNVIEPGKIGVENIPSLSDIYSATKNAGAMAISHS